MPPRKRKTVINEPSANSAKAYDHLKVVHPMRPEVGTQPQFKKRKEPKTYRYDSSLSPTLDWDNNPAREQGEKLISEILSAQSIEEAKNAAENLKAISKPFLNWAGKAERHSFTVPTLPLFIHERLSTKAIMETIKDKKRNKQTEMELFSDPQHPVADQVLRAYEHGDRWVNRMILGDSLFVMNSLLEYENMAGKVQTIFLDPPYGISFGSNFQPFVKDRTVRHNDDGHMTREPEMVQAYRDTWELGQHSYLTYLRDRLVLIRRLLNESGSVFIQISDDNLHLVRNLLDEVFGAENFCAIIPFRKKTWPMGAKVLEQMYDFILWYGKQREGTDGRLRVKYNKLFLSKSTQPDNDWSWYELPDGSRHKMTRAQIDGEESLPAGARIYRLRSLEPSGPNASGMFDFELDGRFAKHPKRGWATDRAGMEELRNQRRLQFKGNLLNFVWFQDDFPLTDLTTPWTDTVGASDKTYVVQTNIEVVKRCILMTTDPGDLVLDPTCGSGTTAYVAETWGRRWITMDASRVPLALAKQRMLVATYPYFELKDESMGPGGGFVYKRKQNRQGLEVGGIVPHITPKSIAKGTRAEEEVRFDCPEKVSGITRVTGPFVFEATIPVPFDGEGYGSDDMRVQGEEPETFVDRLVQVLQRSPTLKLSKNHEIRLKNIRRPTKTLTLSAEAIAVNGKETAVAFIFGPENGSISEKLIYEAAKEAEAKKYSQLIAIGFSIEPNARLLIDKCEQAVGIPAMYAQATPDIMMGDLLKTTRSSQIFSICGLPDFSLNKVKSKSKSDPLLYQVVLEGLDTFDATSMELSKLDGNDVPAWFLDTNYNNLVFHVDQAFFPRTAAWDGLRKALKGTYEEEVWSHLSGNKSAPFEAGQHGQVAIKVIDDRGNELIAVRPLKEAE